jgi:hypothetical protein
MPYTRSEPGEFITFKMYHQTKRKFLPIYIENNISNLRGFTGKNFYFLSYGFEKQKKCDLICKN